MLKRRQVLAITNIAVISFLVGTLFNMNFVATGGDSSPWNKVWKAISELQSRVDTLETTVEILEARIRALETPTKIKIEAYPTTDIYMRSHGLSIDEPLPDGWWLFDGYEFKVTGSAFTYLKTVSLAYGSHYVEYAASGYVPNYAWYARIYINDVLTAEGDVGRYDHLRAYFDVGN